MVHSADLDATASLAGVAITSNNAPGSEGVWQYSTDAGANWYSIGVASDAASVVFDTTTRLRFVAAANFNGGPTVLTSRALDNTFVGSFTSGITIETTDTSSNGNSTPISSTLRNVSSVVIPVNDAPVESTIEGGNVAYTENAVPIQITNTIAIADVDDTNIESAVIQITGNYATGEDVLAFTNTINISGTWNALTGTMSLSGSDTLANYEAALRSITYANTSDGPSELTRTVSFTVNDGSLNSGTLMRGIDVTAVNDAPTATNLNTAESYTEDTALNLTDIVVSDVDNANTTVTLTLSDVSAGSLSTATSGGVTSTFVGGVWTASGAIADVNVLLAGVTFNPTLNYNSNFSIATSVDDGVAPAITGSKAFTATAVNDAPTATNLNAAESYTEDTSLNLTNIVVTDIDSANVTVTLTLSDVTAGTLSTATSGLVTSTFVGGVWTCQRRNCRCECFTGGCHVYANVKLQHQL